MGVKMGASVCNVSGSTAAGDFSACSVFGTGLHGPKVNQTTSEWKKHGDTFKEHFSQNQSDCSKLSSLSTYSRQGIPPSASLKPGMPLRLRGNDLHMKTNHVFHCIKGRHHESQYAYKVPWKWHAKVALHPSCSGYILVCSLKNKLP